MIYNIIIYIIHNTYNLFQVPPGRVLPGAGERQWEGARAHFSLHKVGRRGQAVQPRREAGGAQQSLLHQHHQPLRLDILLWLPRYHIRSDAQRSHGQPHPLPSPRPQSLHGGWRGERLSPSSVTSLSPVTPWQALLFLCDVTESRDTVTGSLVPLWRH